MPNSSQPHDLPSHRSFGFIFTVVFLLIGLSPTINGNIPFYWAIVVAAIFLLFSLIIPVIFRPLNLIWLKFGMSLHVIVNPLIMGGLFYFAVTPMALALRIMGKDILRLKLDQTIASYWIVRTPPGPSSDSLNNQY